MLQSDPGRFVQVEIEIEQRNSQLRMLFGVYRNSFDCVAFDDFSTFHMADRTIQIVEIDGLLNHLGTVVTEISLGNIIRIFWLDRAEALEGIEADNPAI